ncbi:metal ABC transporter solute-binding protein, Zn/Mn family [Aliamphritea ceti]|uniref:metal ABC transporter solute-binding protein, Zn/Mn family n=1 Tax=Aliamphritea ceti TaxID=1524258 RepID=UPI0021C4133B|nr:zinc ABC transporter substrate-binding protein [Aliamphritea ceti]
MRVFIREKLLRVIFLSLFTSLAFAQEKLNVVTTTGMIADLVANIGGEHVRISSLMGSGVDPHLYKATQGDVSKLLNADLIIYNGLHLEGKMQDIFTKLSRQKAVYALADGIDRNGLLESADYVDLPDPHIWFDVQLWREAAEYVAGILSQQLPQHQAVIAANHKAYSQQLVELDDWVRDSVFRIPPSQRVLVTAHDAFGYFARAYDVEVKALQGVNTASEFGLHDLKKIREVIITRQIKAVFIESSVPRKFIQSLQEGLLAKGYPIVIGGELFSDAMGPAGTEEGTYVGMVKHNVNTIVEALL